MKMTIEELKQWVKENSENGKRADAIRELIAIRELKGDQVPVGWIKSSPNEAVSWDSVDPIYLAGSNAPVGWRSDYKPVYNRPQKPVVWLGDIAIHDDLHEVGALVSYDDVVAAIEAAGGIVKDGE